MLNSKIKELQENIEIHSKEVIFEKIRLITIQQDFSLKILKSSERILNF
jgi:hypothetical protein